MLLSVSNNSGDNPRPIPEEEYHMKEKIEKLKAAHALSAEKKRIQRGADCDVERWPEEQVRRRPFCGR